MKARLFCPTGEFSNLSLIFGDAATVGRRPENDISIPSSRVSGRHAIVQWSEEARGYVLEDLKSTNGTFVAGVPVRRPEKLHSLDAVSFGGVEFVFQVLDEAAGGGPHPDRTVVEGAAGSGSDAGPGPDRTVVEGAADGGASSDATVFEKRPPAAPPLPESTPPGKDDR